MSRFRLAYGIHNHQPVGNFEAVFEEAHIKAYLPFLSLIEQYENIAFSLHQSGILWKWQERAHPDYFPLVGKMVDRGQLELLTGGFYEPILTAIPKRDVEGQIARLTKYISDHFEVVPEGLWLTERIWEPHLPRTLSESGVTFLPIDDTHFIYAGLEHHQLTGPFVTEHEGHAVTLLPIQKRLRYLIPFGTVEEVIDELKSQAERNPEGLAVYADDGEKFGIWPQTYEHCYVDGWLDRFFEAVSQHSDWLEVVPLGTAAKIKPVGRIYLPSASYAEMLHWSLPAQANIEYETFENYLREHNLSERYERFVRGGHWRGFLVKYEESNLMHKKALAVSEKLADFEKEHPNQIQEVDAARDRLYAGQCNCPYWHGVFGGLYLPHIRQAIWQALIEADKRLDDLLQTPLLMMAEEDFDFDGHTEVIVKSKQHTAIIKPGRGGTLLHLALNEQHFDVTDTLMRRKEGYHYKLDQAVTGSSHDQTSSIHDLVLAKEEGLKELLIDDWYLKRCLIDHFFAGNVDFDSFRSGRFGEEGDFILEPYEYETKPDSSDLILTRDGCIRRNGEELPVRVVKRLSFQKPGIINVHYQLSTSSPQVMPVLFAIENNFNFQAGHAEDRFIMVNNQRQKNSFLDSEGDHDMCDSYALIDQYRSLAVAATSSLTGQLWHLPIHTVSLSEGGFEKVYQGTTLVNLYKLELSADPVEIEFALYAGSAETIPSDFLSGHSVKATQS